jgi:hypothetical protein
MTGVLAHCGGYPILRMYCPKTEYLKDPKTQALGKLINLLFP